MRLATALFVLFWTLPATAQEFSVIAADPAPGDSSVALQTIVRFTFSAPVDTSFRFTDVSPWPVEFYAISPADSIQIDSTYFNEDLTELSFEVTHTDDTDFVWVMTGVLDEVGTLLCQPYVLSYTTADRTGEWSVSGQLQYAVTTKANNCFLGLIATLWDRLPAEGGGIVAAAVGSEENEVQGMFRINNVRSGKYWPIGLLSQEGLTPPIFPSNYYDPDHDGLPDSLVVADSSRTGLEILVIGAGATQDPTELPGVASLLPNYPNPFNPQTTLAFRLERPMQLRLTVFDLLGRQVATVADGFYTAGAHTETWMTGNMPSGMYVVRLQGARFQLARPVMLIK